MEPLGPDEEKVSDSLLFNCRNRLGICGVEQKIVDYSEPNAGSDIDAGPVTGGSRSGRGILDRVTLRISSPRHVHD